MVEETSEKPSPSKMSDKSPPKEQKPQQRSGKGFTYEVVLLDGEHVNIELDRNADGKDLFEKVCQHLDVIEKDYFGLQYVDERIPQPLKCWLSPDKKISKQKKRGPWLFDFALKFYPPDPTQLRESLTRWLVVLQTRRDVLNGKLPATFLTQAMLGSYCVQADVGDYDSTEHHGIDYVKDIPFAPNQTIDLLEKIVELHRQHKGQTPDEAEMHYLENSKKLSMFGVDLHAAQDVNNVDIMLGVCASGLQVYRDKLRMSRFVWPKILKISYKRKHFYIKVRPADNSRLENTVSFKLASHRLAKRLWKISVEHHAFFRLREADQPQNAAMFPRLGSKFRYSGRTLYQARHSSQILDRPDPYFERSQPARNTYAAPPSVRSRSVDELTNRPEYWKDDMDADVKRRPPSEGKEGRDKRDHIGQPTVMSMVGLPEGMKPVENEEGREMEPGLDNSRDGRNRQDRKPGDDDATLEKEGVQGTMALTPAEMQKKAKEDEKERKKREKEEEKRRKKEEEERKKAAKKGKGKGAVDPTAEDRADLMGAGDATEIAPGRQPGSYADQEGEPVKCGVVAPVGSAPGEKGKGKDKDRWNPRASDKDRWSPGKDDPNAGKWEPGTSPDDVELRQPSSPGKDGQWDPEKDNKDRFSSFKDPGGIERWSFNKERPKSGQGRQAPGQEGDRRSPGRDGEDKDRFAPGDRDGRSPGRDGDRDRFSPDRERDGDRSGPRRDGEKGGPYYPAGERDGREVGPYFVPGEELPAADKDHCAPGVVVPLGSGREEDPDKKDVKDKDGKKGRKGSKKDKERKGSDKDDDKDKKHKSPDKDKKKDKDGDKPDKEKKGGLFGKFKKPKESKSKLPEEDKSPLPEDGVDRSHPGYGPGNQGNAYPVPGLGIGAGDMTGVVGDESWVDNKMRFEPIVPPKKESKDSLKSQGLSDIDHTMPFFSPAATSTVGRPSKVPPPISPKPNSNASFDDSFSRRDYKTEKDGIQETRVEHKVVLSSTDDDFDYDSALADAIRSVTEFNPDMSVERIECVQQIEEVNNK